MNLEERLNELENLAKHYEASPPLVIFQLVKALRLAVKQRDEGFAKWASAIRDLQANGPVCEKYDAAITAILEGRADG